MTYYCIFCCDEQPKFLDLRKSLMPRIGFLYPEGVESLCASEDPEALGKALDKYWVYRRIFQTAIVNEGMSIDDAFYLNEIRLLEGGFDSQFQLSEFFVCMCDGQLVSIAIVI